MSSQCNVAGRYQYRSSSEVREYRCFGTKSMCIVYPSSCALQHRDKESPLSVRDKPQTVSIRFVVPTRMRGGLEPRTEWSCQAFVMRQMKRSSEGKLPGMPV